MLDWLREAIRNAEESQFAREKCWRFTLNLPASAEEMDRTEAALDLAFPPDLRAFLARWNGASLFRVEVRWPNGQTVLGTHLGIWSTSEILDQNRKLRSWVDPNDAAGWDGLVLFGDVPAGGEDYCALSPTPDGGSAVVDCPEGYGPSCWRRLVVEPSLDTWLRRLFDEAARTGDPYYWLNDPEIRAMLRECDREMREAAPAPRSPSPPPAPQAAPPTGPTGRTGPATAWTMRDGRVEVPPDAANAPQCWRRSLLG
jgi:hypothetical protein